MKQIFLAVILSTVLVSCSSDDNQSFSTQEIDFYLIAKANPNRAFYDNSETALIVFTNTSDWNYFLSEISESINVEFAFSETEIDFDVFEVIAVIRAPQPTESEIEITNIIEHLDFITVTTVSNNGAATIPTQPFHIVKIPKSSKPVVLE